MGKCFGTDGFRGKTGVDLTAEHAFRVGHFLGWYYSRQHTEGDARIVIGKDTRRSSDMFKNALAAGVVSSGTMPVCCMLPPRPVSAALPGRRILTVVS